MKKILLIVFIFLLVITGCENKTEEEIQIDKKVDQMLEEMTLDEKIGQMLMIFYRSDTYDSTLDSSLKEVKPGGMILFSENFKTYEDSINLIKKVKSTSEIPMFISIDQEGGKVQRLSSLEDEEVTIIPSMYDLGKMNDLDLTKKVGKVVGEELRVFGINMDFAPVMDIYENPDNKVIGKRSFGYNAEIVTNQALAFADGLKETGIIPVYKHFPGHGNTSEDSHYELPVVNKTKKELLNDDLIPFIEAIKNKEDVIMIGHLAVPSITGDNTPASLSREIITDLLKKELGFKGLVVTDALNMGALTNTYTQEEIYIKAINAGVDILLMPKNSREALKSIREAVNKGMISESTIDNSVKKILTLKYSKVEKEYNDYLNKSYLNSKPHKKIIDSIEIE